LPTWLRAFQCDIYRTAWYSRHSSWHLFPAPPPRAHTLRDLLLISHCSGFHLLPSCPPHLYGATAGWCGLLHFTPRACLVGIAPCWWTHSCWFKTCGWPSHRPPRPFPQDAALFCTGGICVGDSSWQDMVNTPTHVINSTDDRWSPHPSPPPPLEYGPAGTTGNTHRPFLHFHADSGLSRATYLRFRAALPFLEGFAPCVSAACRLRATIDGTGGIFTMRQGGAARQAVRRATPRAHTTHTTPALRAIFCFYHGVRAAHALLPATPARCAPPSACLAAPNTHAPGVPYLSGCRDPILNMDQVLDINKQCGNQDHTTAHACCACCARGGRVPL